VYTGSISLRHKINGISGKIFDGWLDYGLLLPDMQAIIERMGELERQE
jgi:hypothetical protein